jgi:chromosome segregation ATPase
VRSRFIFAFFCEFHQLLFFSHKKQIVQLQGDLDRLRDLLKDTESDMRKYQNQYQDSMDLIEKLTSNNVDLKIKVTEFSSEVGSG